MENVGVRGDWRWCGAFVVWVSSGQVWSSPGCDKRYSLILRHHEEFWSRLHGFRVVHPFRLSGATGEVHGGTRECFVYAIWTRHSV